MSAPDSRHGPSTPLHARSQSQNNSKLGIRLVPYTPPKLDEERAPSQASFRENAGSRSDGNYEDQRGRLLGSQAGHSRRRSERSEVTTESYAGKPGPALSSPIAPTVSLVSSRGERVSGLKPLVSPSGLGQAHPTTAPLKSPSDVATNIAATNASAQPSRAAELPSSPVVAAPRSSSRPPSRRRTIIALNPDNKTFSLVVRNDQQDPEPPVSASLTGSLRSPHLSYASTRSSTHERPSIDLWSDSRAETPMTGVSTTLLDTTLTVSEPPSPLPSSPGSSITATQSQLAEDPITASPWSYRMVGGIRKVAQTPEPEPAPKQSQYDTDSSPSERPLSPLLEDPTNKEEEVTPTRKKVAPKASFASAVSDQTIDTISDNTNYKVYGPSSSAQQSSDSLVFNSASPANWEALGDASPAPIFRSSPPGSSSDAGENYVVYGSSSASPSSSQATVSRKPRPSYSQESLRVAPLRPVKKRSNEKFGYYKQRSRETLRSRASSIQSIKSVSSAIANQANQDPTFLTAPVVIHLAPLSARSSQEGASGSTSKTPTWLAPPVAAPSKPQVSVTPPSTAQMIPSPHLWSSQLSTVMSESEVDSDPIQTRSVSPLSETSGHHRRQSSGRVSSIHSRQGSMHSHTHSRQMHSISSSIAGQLDEGAFTSSGSGSGSGSDSAHRPQASFSRPDPRIRMVTDQDEYGDGITDLNHKPSRTGLSGFFNNSNGSSRGLHSSASNHSRANSVNSTTFNAAIPAWARVYYGSGERRWLGRSPSFVSLSDHGSRPGSSRFFDRDLSPDQEQFPPQIYSPRKRARDAELGEQDEDQISPAPQNYGVFRTLREKTSSIWSPHLGQDRRASRYRMWDPPSVNWSADSGMMGRRNSQVICFIVGFIFPFAWMIGAILPLPDLWRLEKNASAGKGAQKQPEYQYKPRFVDEKRYESARWWRNLNRGMSVIGLLIIGAVVALAVIGVKQGWGQHES
ncbi:hypothetical protein QBC35DRAFT_451032 [Podospora australis]|uniref:Serine-rich protein n=1 Tax=Podospora australis TaxID=1536484 RepID=A0AAN6WZ72_9PEZI|nr:hypothetical protein QBC35DRAFT_451032 [Podospora australis]